MILLKTFNGIWEEVSESVYKERKNVINDDGSARYTGDVIIKNGSNITISGTFSQEDLGKTARYLEINIPSGSYKPVIETPESVMIKRARSIRLHMIKTGQEFVPARR